MTDCTFTEDDARWMRQALDLAHHSASLNEVPVGAVIVRDLQLLGQGWNAALSISIQYPSGSVMKASPFILPSLGFFTN